MLGAQDNQEFGIRNIDDLFETDALFEKEDLFEGPPRKAEPDQQSQKTEKICNLYGLTRDTLGSVVISLLSCPQMKGKDVEVASRELIQMAWSEAASEVNSKREAIGYSALIFGEVFGVIAPFCAIAAPLITSIGVIGFVGGLSIGYRKLTEAATLRIPQTNSTTLFASGPDAWEDEEVYDLAREKIPELIKSLYNAPVPKKMFLG